MAENLGDAVLTLRTDDRELEKGLARGEARAERTAARFDQIGARMQGLGKNLSVAMTLPLGAFAVQSGQAASDAEELQSAFNTTFGAMSGDMNEWARVTGDAMGRSTQELQRAANMFGIFFNQAAPTKQAAAELSKEFSALAQDLASFYNVDAGEALAKLRSGLSGESEPLRDFGVFLTEAAVKAKGLEMGLATLGEEMTEQEKIMARAALIMEQTKNAQGDVARTSGSTANQVRAAKAAWEELQVTIGTKLLPVITPLITRLAELLNGFAGLSPTTQTAIVAALGLGVALGPLLAVVGTLARGVGLLIPLLAGAGPMLATIGGALAGLVPIIGSLGGALLALAINPVFLTIAALVGGVYLAWKHWDDIKAIIGGVGSALSEWWTDTVQPVLGWVGKAVADAYAIFEAVFGRQLRAVVAGVAALLRGDFKGAWEAAKTFVAAPVDGMRALLQRFVPDAIGWFRDLYTGVKTWLEDRLGAIFEAVKNKIASVGDKFRWLWDVVVGNSYVPDLVDGIEAEFARLGNVMVRPAQAAAAATAAAFAGIQAPVGGFAGVGAAAAGAAGDAAGGEAEWRANFQSWVGQGIRAALDGDLGDFFASWLERAADRGLSAAIDQVAQLLTGLLSDSGLGGILSEVFSSIFAGGFHTGGLIPAGQFGIVGERGPEPVISTPRGALVRPNRSLSSSEFRPAGPSINMPISINAPGADAAALERVRAELAALQRDLPTTIVGTMQDATDRRIYSGGGRR